MLKVCQVVAARHGLLVEAQDITGVDLRWGFDATFRVSIPLPDGTALDPERLRFEALAEAFPDTRFRWLDIEDRADDLGDLDIENFPTLFIQRRDSILFFGTMLPHLDLLRRLVETFHEQSLEESQAYARANPERAAWQQNADLSRLRHLTRP